MQPLPNPDLALAPALDALAADDPQFAAAYALCGLPPIRRTERGFAGLARIVCGQQLSVHAAAAIWTRMQDAGAVSASAIDASTDDALRALGLSRAKIRSLRALAAATTDGSLDLYQLDKAEDGDIRAAITALPGFGRWSVEMYLLFALDRPDIWPAGDLAVRKALGRLRGMDEAPAPKTTDALGEAFRPRRSAAARFLWHYFKHPGVA